MYIVSEQIVYGEGYVYFASDRLSATVSRLPKYQLSFSLWLLFVSFLNNWSICWNWLYKTSAGPRIRCSLFLIYALALNWFYKFLFAQNQKLLNFQNSVEKRECMHDPLLNVYAFLPIGWNISWILTKLH